MTLPLQQEMKEVQGDAMDEEGMESINMDAPANERPVAHPSSR